MLCSVQDGVGILAAEMKQKLAEDAARRGSLSQLSGGLKDLLDELLEHLVEMSGTLSPLLDGLAEGSAPEVKRKWMRKLKELSVMMTQAADSDSDEELGDDWRAFQAQLDGDGVRLGFTVEMQRLSLCWLRLTGAACLSIAGLRGGQGARRGVRAKDIGV